MPDIKTRKKSSNIIKKLDKGLIYAEKTKDNIVNLKNKTNYAEQNSTNEYAENKVEESIGIIFRKGKRTFNEYGKKAIPNAKKNITNMKNRVKELKNVTSKTLKQTGKGIKTAEKAGKITAKTTKATTKGITKVAKESIKRGYQISKLTAKMVVRGIKITIKATISAIKLIIAGTKALISFLIAGGWIAIVVIILICLIAILCSSIYGIFFSSENTGSKITIGANQESVTMSKVISNINNEFVEKITSIQRNNIYDEYIIDSNRAEWKNILAIYSAEINGGNNQDEVLTLNDERVEKLRKIFWEMNKITYRVESNLNSDNTSIKTLYIHIDSKSVDEMMNKYNFNLEQKEQVRELTSESYASMWNSVIYGNSIGSNDIVSVAISQIGNIGGQPYWAWYGFNSRVEWCACFISWCANECGYIEKGIVPKFASCQAEGVSWFKACNLWKDRDFMAKAGDIIFFDWQDEITGIRNGQADHVGIVEKVENGKVYTIEGNSEDKCLRKNYSINSQDILGYGTPMYN